MLVVALMLGGNLVWLLLLGLLCLLLCLMVEWLLWLLWLLWPLCQVCQLLVLLVVMQWLRLWWWVLELCVGGDRRKELCTLCGDVRVWLWLHHHHCPTVWTLDGHCGAREAQLQSRLACRTRHLQHIAPRSPCSIGIPHCPLRLARVPLSY